MARDADLMAVRDPDRAIYGGVIDRLVSSCRDGQGAIGPTRVRSGLWNANATSPDGLLAEQFAFNRLLARLEPGERDCLATMLEQAFVSGVHEALVVLHETQI